VPLEQNSLAKVGNEVFLALLAILMLFLQSCHVHAFLLSTAVRMYLVFLLTVTLK